MKMSQVVDFTITTRPQRSRYRLRVSHPGSPGFFCAQGPALSVITMPSVISPFSVLACLTSSQPLRSTIRTHKATSSTRSSYAHKAADSIDTRIMASTIVIDALMRHSTSALTLIETPKQQRIKHHTMARPLSFSPHLLAIHFALETKYIQRYSDGRWTRF
jgi:hypothetical protein